MLAGVLSAWHDGLFSHRLRLDLLSYMGLLPREYAALSVMGPLTLNNNQENPSTDVLTGRSDPGYSFLLR